MQIKVNAGRFKAVLNLESISENRLKVRFKFNKRLIKDIKTMRGARWNPEGKYWIITDCSRNWFRLNYMQGKKMYARFDKDLVYPTFQRALYEHQKDMVAHGLTRRQCIFGCEMGTGKTLSAIEIMERSGFTDWWWIGPKSALAAVELEFWKWDCLIKPKMYTYDGLKRVLASWPDGDVPPRGLVFDESSKLKTPTAQRSEAAAHLCTSMREHHDDPYIIEMSGTPAPKNPVDWWNQAEIAYPGFLREGHPTKLKAVMAKIEMQESIAGGEYPKLITWWDDEDKCAHCGMYQLSSAGIAELAPEVRGGYVDHLTADHSYEKSVNEVRRLYQRLKGLVLVRLKKDCLNLPDKNYQEIVLEPSKSMLRAAGIIAAKSPRAITALTLLRELSDGFQYEDVEGVRIIKQVKTPKEGALREILENHEDIGRLVVYAGFSASVDRVTSICVTMGWNVIQVDGRGWHTFGPLEGSNPELLAQFQDGKGKIVFTGQPGAGGMGLTLTASPTITYWSNDFNGESRMQSEDRVHRIGMDINRGANIIDLLHLPTDKLVLDNLRKKKKLQDISLGVVQTAMKGEAQR